MYKTNERSRQRRSRATNDAIVIAILSVVVFTFSALLDEFNTIITWIYAHDTWQLDEIFTLALFLVLSFGIYTWRRLKELQDQIRQRERAENEKALLVPRLESALAEVRTLRELLPICAWCKKIRDEKGGWTQVEVYLEARTNAQLTHGICPDCARKYYADHLAGTGVDPG